MITTIIFDFDGTLADTLPFVEKKLFKMLKEEKAFQNLLNKNKKIKDKIKKTCAVRVL